MYLHPAFRIDTEEALPILVERSFGQLVVPTGTYPFGVHAPFLVECSDNGRLRVEMHVARANTIHEHIGRGSPAVLICEAGNHYISPDWYVSENQVPTWTYVAVHLKGTASVLPAEANLDHVDRLSAHFERRLAPKKPWTSDKMDERKRDAMLRAIVVIALEVETVEAQKKLIQHKTEADRRGAVEGLAGLDTPAASEIAALIAGTLSEK
jgi:transcriptional regulator